MIYRLSGFYLFAQNRMKRIPTVSIHLSICFFYRKGGGGEVFPSVVIKYPNSRISQRVQSN